MPQVAAELESRPLLSLTHTNTNNFSVGADAVPFRTALFLAHHVLLSLRPLRIPPPPSSCSRFIPHRVRPHRGTNLLCKLFRSLWHFHCQCFLKHQVPKFYRKIRLIPIADLILSRTGKKHNNSNNEQSTRMPFLLSCYGCMMPVD